MRSALWLPLFDALADPRVVVDLAVEAEAAGWDGLFVWDHVRWREPVQAVADPWVVLTAVAAATTRLRIGPMVTPVARRRPQVLARQTATLDVLSGGRLTLGVGLGSDRFGEELSRFGEVLDDRERAVVMDETLAVLTGAWSGEPVRQRGRHVVVDDVRFLPRPVHGTVPVWVAGFPGNRRPLARAARYDGFVPVNLEHPDQLAESVAVLRGLGVGEGFVVAVPLADRSDVPAYEAAGGTWWLSEVDHERTSVDTVRGILREGPA